MPHPTPPPQLPWQFTGNHWISIPCIHPADASIHCLSLITRRLRGAIDFAGAPNFMTGTAPAFLRLDLEVNGTRIDLSAAGMAWQRISEWLPTFNATVGNLTIRGTIFAPYGRPVEMPAVIYALSFETKGREALQVRLTPNGTLGLRQHRIQTGRPLDDQHTYMVDTDHLTLFGTSSFESAALAIALDQGTATAEHRDPAGAVTWSITSEFTVFPGQRHETAIYIAAAQERDGACAALETLRLRGWKPAAHATNAALAKLEQATGVPAVDRLINRHLLFTYFFCVVRAIDDAQIYIVRTRSPWNHHGLTVRDWDAHMWIIPAIQLADPDLARELIMRMCEIHGYAPGRGVNYFDGVPFQIGFSIDGAASYVIAINRYITQTGDDRLVEEHTIADTLYASYEDIASRRDDHKALYTTDYTASGRVELPYVLHSNVVVAYALDLFKSTLDEKTADKVESGDIVRAAIKRHFLVKAGDKEHSGFATAIDLEGGTSIQDDPVGSVYWMPNYGFLSTSDALYRRTALNSSVTPGSVASECAKLLGPDASVALGTFRRAIMDNGVAAELIDEGGNAIHNGGDAALSGLIAHSVWYAVTMLGVRP